MIVSSGEYWGCVRRKYQKRGFLVCWWSCIFSTGSVDTGSFWCHLANQKSLWLASGASARGLVQLLAHCWAFSAHLAWYSPWLGPTCCNWLLPLDEAGNHSHAQNSEIPATTKPQGVLSLSFIPLTPGVANRGGILQFVHVTAHICSCLLHCSKGKHVPAHSVPPRVAWRIGACYSSDSRSPKVWAPRRVTALFIPSTCSTVNTDVWLPVVFYPWLPLKWVGGLPYYSSFCSCPVAASRFLSHI